jgi:hypothetical protein
MISNLAFFGFNMATKKLHSKGEGTNAGASSPWPDQIKSYKDNFDMKLILPWSYMGIWVNLV